MKALQVERNEAKAESDSALERLRVTMANHNAKMAEQSKDIHQICGNDAGRNRCSFGRVRYNFAISNK